MASPQLSLSLLLRGPHAQGCAAWTRCGPFAQSSSDPAVPGAGMSCRASSSPPLLADTMLWTPPVGSLSCATGPCPGLDHLTQCSITFVWALTCLLRVHCHAPGPHCPAPQRSPLLCLSQSSGFRAEEFRDGGGAEIAIKRKWRSRLNFL